jgi:hypothetical protein
VGFHERQISPSHLNLKKKFCDVILRLGMAIVTIITGERTLHALAL